jgi:hypothetical protein
MGEVHQSYARQQWKCSWELDAALSLYENVLQLRIVLRPQHSSVCVESEPPASNSHSQHKHPRVKIDTCVVLQGPLTVY